MAEGYKSALIASLRGDAPQGPRMGSGISSLVFDWMKNNGVPLSFEARRMALLNPERLALPFPATRPMPTGGYEDGPIPPEVDPNEPDLGPPPALEEPQVVSEGGAGDAPMPPPPPEPKPEIPYVPEEEQEKEEEQDSLVGIEPVNAGDDIFADDYIPAEEVVIPDISEEEQEEEEEQESIVQILPVEDESPWVNELLPTPEPIVPETLPDQDLADFLDSLAPPVIDDTVGEVTVTDLSNNPLRDYGSDLGTTVIEGAFDPTLGGTFDPGSEIISPISGPNNPYENPFIGLSPQQLNELLFGGP